VFRTRAAMASRFLIANSQSKQTLRDAFRRLKRIRATCGEKDEDAGRENDPLLQCVARFQQRVEDAQVRLGESTDAMADTERLHLRRAVIGAREELRELEEMLAKADALYNTAVLKQKAAEKVAALEAARDRCRRAFDQAQECMGDVQRSYDEQMERDAASVDRVKKQKRALKANDGSATREPVQAADGGVAERRTMRRAMDMLARSQGVLASSAGGDDDDDPDATAMAERDALAGGVSALAADASTKQQYAKIREQKREVSAALTRIHASVTKLHDMSRAMAVEIDTQSHRIERLDSVVEQRQQTLQDLNNRIDELHESAKPLNTCFNVMLCLLILGIVGYLLRYFGVIAIGSV
jgi:chromosome segregation ATPase